MFGIFLDQVFGQFGVFFVEVVVFEEVEVIGQQFLGFGGVGLFVVGVEYYGDYVLVVVYCGSYQVVVGFVGVVGFQVVDGFVVLQQQVVVWLFDVVLEEFFLCVDCVVVWFVVDDCVGQYCYVVGGGIVVWVGQVGGVYEVGVGQVQFLCGGVYYVGEGVFVVGDMFGQGNVGVVVGLDDDVMQQVVY